jgi:hypothetical protein
MDRKTIVIKFIQKSNLKNCFLVYFRKLQHSLKNGIVQVVFVVKQHNRLQCVLLRENKFKHAFLTS